MVQLVYVTSLKNLQILFSKKFIRETLNKGTLSQGVESAQSHWSYRRMKMNWEDIVLEGLKSGVGIVDALPKAAEAAPATIRKILKDFPLSMNYSEKDIERFKKSRQGTILLLLRSYWLSLCGEAFQLFPLDNQKDILESGVRASIEAARLASTLNERELEVNHLFRAGRALYDLGRLAEAEDMYNEVLKKYRELAKTPSDRHSSHAASTVNNLGLIYYKTNQFSRAEKAFKEALYMYRMCAQRDPHVHMPYIALALTNLGTLYSHVHNFTESERFHGEALKIYERLAEKNPDYESSLATTFNNLGTLYWNLKDFAKSEKAYNEALAIRRRLAGKAPDMYEPSLAITLNNIGVLYLDTGKYKEAEDVLKKALAMGRKLVQKNPDVHTHDVTTFLRSLGRLYCETGKYKEAEAVVTEALTMGRELVQKNPDAYSSDVASILKELGSLYFKAGKFFEANTTYAEALKTYRELAQKIPDVYNLSLACVLNDVGVFYRETKRFSHAERAHTEALTILRGLAQKTPDVYTLDVAETLTNVGNLLREATEFSQAEDVFKEVLTMTRELAQKNPNAYNRCVATALNNLGNLYYETGKFQKAEETFRQALHIYRALAQKDPDVYDDHVAHTLHNLGAVYQKSQNLQKAEESITEALTITRARAQKTPDVYEVNMILMLNNLGALYHNSNNFLQAEKAYKEALTIAKRKALWLELAETYHNFSILSNEKFEESIKLLELGILFSEEKKYKYAQKGRRESIYLRYFKFTNDPQKIIGVLEALRDPDLLSLQWDVEIKRDNSYQKKIVKETLRKKIPPLSIAHVQIPRGLLFLYVQKLDKDILYAAVTQEGTAIYRSTLDFADVAARVCMNLRVQSYAGRRRRDFDELVANFDDLSEKWTEKLPSHVKELIIEKETIVFSPDSTVSSFPLEGLSINGEPVCLLKPVMRATSMHQMHKMSSQRMGEGPSLIVGNPWPSINENSLAYTHPSKIGPLTHLGDAVREANTLAEMLPHPDVLTGSHATADRVLAELPHYSLIHFAGHGYVGRVLFFSGPMTRIPPEFEPEEFSELRKAWRSVNGKTIYMTDEWDFITDIDILDTPLKRGAFIFLSACETGKHKYAGGGHFQGLARAFLKSGASHVISSLIPVYDTPARDFALSFYKTLFSHTSVSTALQNTRRKMKKKYNAHVYWLPYIHYGSPVEPDPL